VIWRCVCRDVHQNNQKDLETVTEQLSEYLERDITSDTLCDIKQKVQDKSRSDRRISKCLLPHANEVIRVPPDHGKSWNFGRPFSRPGKSWKIAKVMENGDNVMEFLLLH